MRNAPVLIPPLKREVDRRSRPAGASPRHQTLPDAHQLKPMRSIALLNMKYGGRRPVALPSEAGYWKSCTRHDLTSTNKPKFHQHPGPAEERASAFTHRGDHEGAVSTLCAGCGHDLDLPASIIEACFELSIEPHRVAKLSGIGCSSKTPTYFLGNSHGFNSVHGRMPSVLTGANLANRDLIYLGVSGDGD